MYTPRCFLRLETEILSLKLFLIKSVMKFVYRILNKPKDSLVRQCFDALKSLYIKKGAESKPNWYGQVCNILKEYNVYDKMDITNVHLKDPKNLIENLYKILPIISCKPVSYTHLTL